MTDEQKKDLKSKIKNEGFDYTFTGYSRWDEIKDEEFQKFKHEFIIARETFMNYLKKNLIEVIE